MGAKQYSPWERSAAAPQTTPIYSAFDVAFSTLERRSEWQLVLIALLMLGGVGLADYFTGAELAFSIFYLAPVVFVGWFVSGRMGVLFAALAAITWAYLDIAFGPHFSSFAHAWNAVVRFAFFVIVLLLTLYAKHSSERERVTARTDSLTSVPNGRPSRSEPRWLSPASGARDSRSRSPTSTSTGSSGSTTRTVTRPETRR